MKSITKMWFCIAVLFILSGVYQFTIGNKGALIIGGILLFGIGLGWYGKCVKMTLSTGRNKNDK